MLVAGATVENASNAIHPCAIRSN